MRGGAVLAAILTWCPKGKKRARQKTDRASGRVYQPGDIRLDPSFTIPRRASSCRRHQVLVMEPGSPPVASKETRVAATNHGKGSAISVDCRHGGGCFFAMHAAPSHTCAAPSRTRAAHHIRAPPHHVLAPPRQAVAAVGVNHVRHTGRILVSVGGGV